MGYTGLRSEFSLTLTNFAHFYYQDKQAIGLLYILAVLIRVTM